MDGIFVNVVFSSAEYARLAKAALLAGESVYELVRTGALAQAEMLIELEEEHDREQGDGH